MLGQTGGEFHRSADVIPVKLIAKDIMWTMPGPIHMVTVT